MKTDLNEVIQKLTKKAGEANESADALRFSQAALNTVHILANVKDIEKDK